MLHCTKYNLQHIKCDLREEPTINVQYYITYIVCQPTALTLCENHCNGCVNTPLFPRYISFAVQGNYRLFANNADSYEAARPKLSLLMTALFATKTLSFTKVRVERKVE